MRLFTAAFLCSVLALAAPAAADPGTRAPPGEDSGWRAARWGMTPEEVLAAFPKEATPVAPPVTLADGNVIAAGIDGHALEGLTFDVRFLFTAGKLSLVSLRTPTTKPVEADAYVKLRDALEKRWGPPLEETTAKDFIDMRQTRWSRGATRVDLKYIPGVVAIVFYPAPPP
jgi:hypothetical protein